MIGAVGFHASTQPTSVCYLIAPTYLLNLNQGTLVRNRKAVLEAFRQGLIQANPSDADLRKQLVKWNGDNGGDVAPFCQVVVYYLQKKIARMK